MKKTIQLKKDGVNSNYSGAEHYGLIIIACGLSELSAEFDGTMMNGVQVVDLLLDRKFNNGNSLFAPNK